MSQVKIVLIGAGSASFGAESVIGLAGEQEIHGAKLVLVDIDADALETTLAFGRVVSDKLGADFDFEIETDRRKALPGADFVITSVEIDRLPTWQKDWDLPLKHGMRHIQGENGGPGGMSHSFRSVPLVLDICKDVEDLAPQAMVLNYTNPMTRVCMAVTRYTNLHVVGLCHGVFYTYDRVGTIMGMIDGPMNTEERRKQFRAMPEKIEFEACGLNHITVITQLRDRETGEDLYPAFKQAARDFDPTYEPYSRLFMETFGLYPVQGDSHVGEYLGWAHGRGPGLDEQAPAFEEYRGKVAAAGQGDEEILKELLDEVLAFQVDRAPSIIAATIAGRPQYELGVNVVNNGCIEGLPDWAVVEVPGVVGPSGVRGVAMGQLPPGITAILNNEIAVQDRVVEAAVHGDRNAALQALLLDPVSNKDFDAASALLEDLLTEHAQYLPQFA